MKRRMRKVNKWEELTETRSQPHTVTPVQPSFCSRDVRSYNLPFRNFTLWNTQKNLYLHHNNIRQETRQGLWSLFVCVYLCCHFCWVVQLLSVRPEAVYRSELPVNSVNKQRSFPVVCSYHVFYVFNTNLPHATVHKRPFSWSARPIQHHPFSKLHVLINTHVMGAV